jgi:ribosome-associated toxin RatA of RatAB toxin-antitoxin module
MPRKKDIRSGSQIASQYAMRRLISILSCVMSWHLLLQGITTASADVDWERLFKGDVIVESVRNEEGLSGLKVLMTVQSSRRQIWQLLTDYENFRHLFKHIKKLKVLEQDKQGAYVEFWVDAVITKYHYILYRRYEKPLRRISWQRVAGDLQRIEGSWEIHDTPRPEAKLLIYESYIGLESAIPRSLIRMGAMRRARAMGWHLRQMLEAPPANP